MGRDSRDENEEKKQKKNGNKIKEKKIKKKDRKPHGVCTCVLFFILWGGVWGDKH